MSSAKNPDKQLTLHLEQGGFVFYLNPSHFNFQSTSTAGMPLGQFFLRVTPKQSVPLPLYRVEFYAVQKLAKAPACEEWNAFAQAISAASEGVSPGVVARIYADNVSQAILITKVEKQ